MNFDMLVNNTFLGNTYLRWGLALIAAITVYIIVRLIRRALRGRLGKLADLTTTKIDNMLVDLLAETRSFFFIAAALYVGVRILTFDSEVTTLVNRGFLVILLLQALIWGNKAISFFVQLNASKANISPSERTTLSAINFISRLLLYSLLILIALENFGIDITALIAGLGITSIAVALAVQNILGDLFASLSIVLDKPFEIGDFIVVGDFSGSIEKIGLRSTRLRSLSGEQLVFPNKDLLESRIRNYKRMQERRISFSLGVTYDTAANKLKKIPDLIEAAVSKHDKLRFDRAHFKNLGDFALNFEVVYLMLEPDYVLFMDTQQAINLDLIESFAAEGIDFAFPTQTIQLQQ